MWQITASQHFEEGSWDMDMDNEHIMICLRPIYRLSVPDLKRQLVSCTFLVSKSELLQCVMKSNSYFAMCVWSVPGTLCAACGCQRSQSARQKPCLAMQGHIQNRKSHLVGNDKEQLDGRHFMSVVKTLPLSWLWSDALGIIAVRRNHPSNPIFSF